MTSRYRGSGTFLPAVCAAAIHAALGYAAIVVTLAINFLTPAHMLFFRSFAARTTIATAILCLPV